MSLLESKTNGILHPLNLEVEKWKEKTLLLGVKIIVCA